MAAKTKTQENPRAYLLKGDDDFLKLQELNKLLKVLVSDDFADFDLEQLEGNTATSDRIVSGLSMPPFGSDKRVVLVRYANKLDPDEQLKLASHLEKTPKSGCLILISPAPEKKDGRPVKGSEIVGDLSKAVRKIGEVKEFGKMKAGDATTFAKSLFLRAGKKVDPQALTLFVQRVGSDSLMLVTESQKLIDYSGDVAQINALDVSTVTSETPEEKIFKLVDALSAKDQGAALRFIDELFESGHDIAADAPKTLATIARHFRLLWQIKAMTEAGVRNFSKEAVPESIKAMLPSDPNIFDVLGRQSWMADKLIKQSRPFTRKDLQRCFNSISKADLMLKGIEGGIEDSKMVMELLVIDLAKPINRR